MRRIFGTKKEKPPPPTIDEASGRLTTRGDTMDEKVRKLDEQLMKHRDIIKKTRPGPAQDAAKRRALNVLKQKRLYEGQREQLYNQQFNMDQTAFTMESIKDSVSTVQAMKAANSELKQAFKKGELNIESIEKLQDEMADMHDMHNELQEVMGQTFGVPEDIDEDELMGELDALEDELAMEAERPAAAGAVPAYLQEPNLPEPPTAQLQQPQGVQHGPQHDEFGLPSVPLRN